MTLEQGIGAALILLFLADIFLTVLYARAGTGLLAPRWNRAVWAVFRAVARLWGKRGGTVLSIGGPFIVVSLIVFWALGLTIGAALVIRPELGTTIRPSSGGTPTDFVTALFVAGNSLSIVGGGDYSPHSTGTRLLFLINSLIGASMLSLVLSYLVQVYAGLRERNALALTVDLMTDGTGDAAVMLARLMPGGDSSNAASQLSNLAGALAATKEAHHFYPLLFYFRFEEPAYSVSRLCFVFLDLVSLIETALDQEQYGNLTASASVVSLRRGTRLLLETIDRRFALTVETAEDPASDRRSRQSFFNATVVLANAGISVRLDGAERYIALRRKWEPLSRRVAPALGYDMREVDRKASSGTQESEDQAAR